ncbi:hypothetical protein NDU88_003034 [Pleurodeles waltl]|uniref:Uncharacterized protein n=1 Tax=Pleurodeles waltl TaxID=8319 RepID=A0AAV7NF97_PLEWA|nr:hypothetical protein NDU88_003034 [Pleurodeles waltl]
MLVRNGQVSDGRYLDQDTYPPVRPGEAWRGWGCRWRTRPALRVSDPEQHPIVGGSECWAVFGAEASSLKDSSGRHAPTRFFGVNRPEGGFRQQEKES